MIEAWLDGDAYEKDLSDQRLSRFCNTSDPQYQPQIRDGVNDRLWLRAVKVFADGEPHVRAPPPSAQYPRFDDSCAPSSPFFFLFCSLPVEGALGSWGAKMQLPYADLNTTLTLRTIFSAVPCTVPRM